MGPSTAAGSSFVLCTVVMVRVPPDGQLETEQELSVIAVSLENRDGGSGGSLAPSAPLLVWKATFW